MSGRTAAPTKIKADHLNLPGTVYPIGQLSVLFGISARTIRFYCQLGLLEASMLKMTRHFDRRNVRRLALVRTGIDLGLSLRDISTMLRNCDVDPEQAFLVVSAEKIDEEIATLTRRRTETAEQLRLLLACKNSVEPQLAAVKAIVM